MSSLKPNRTTKRPPFQSSALLCITNVNIKGLIINAETITEIIMDKEKTKVVFRKFKNKEINEVIALFPELSYARNYFTESYMHTGQHSDCDYHAVIAMTTPAQPEDYKDLQAELKGIGYNLLIRQRASITYKR